MGSLRLQSRESCVCHVPAHILHGCLSSAQGIAPPEGLDSQQIVRWRKDAAFLTQLLDNTKVGALAAACICLTVSCHHISCLSPFL